MPAGGKERLPGDLLPEGTAGAASPRHRRRSPAKNQRLQDDPAEGSGFDGRLASFARRLEGFLFRVVVACLVVLAVSQSLMTSEASRVFLSYTEQLEGLDYRRQAPSPESPAAGPQPPGEKPPGEKEAVLEGRTITLILVNRPAAPEAAVLVNGRSVGRFDRDRLTLEVREGDFVQVDLTTYREIVGIRVIQVGERVLYPKVGTEVYASGVVKSLGPVIFR